MLIFLYGQDTYRLHQKLKEIITHYKKIHKSGLNLKYFEGKNLNFRDFKKEMEQTSMFREKKLAVLTNVLLNSEFKIEFLKNSKPRPFSEKGGADDIILFYEEGKIDEKNPLFKFLKKNAKCQEFRPLEGQRLRNWVKKEFDNYQAEIEPQALEKLLNFVGNDLWRLSNEIKKLVSFKKKQKIKREDIELLIKPKIESDIFKTIDAIALKNKKEAFELLHRHLERGDSPLYLLSMINFQFRNLIMVKSSEGDYRRTKDLGLHPYVIKKSFQQAKKFSFQELKKIYQKLFEVDFKIKTGRIDPQTALEMLITEI